MRIAARLIALVMVFTVVPVITATAGAGFSDVPPGAYFAKAVDWLVDQGITQGTSPTTFSPDDPTTRAQMAAFLWRFGFESDGVGHGFADVAPGVYYDAAVGWLLLHEITQGQNPTTYGPGDPVTRAQMAVFLWRYAGEPAPAVPAAFSDVPPQAWFADAVGWLVEEGITQGTSQTTYSPDATVTRAQMATFLWRFAGKPVPGDPGVNRDPKLFDCTLQSSIPAVECDALVAIKTANNPAATFTDWGWVVDPDPAFWIGASVAGGVVTELDLVFYGMSTLPPEIGNLTNLTWLALPFNQLTSVPPEIGNLTNLTYLDLEDNQLTSVPAEIWNLTNLTGLQLPSNQLTSVPPEIGNLTKLTSLGLQSNQLTSVPPEIGNLTNLAYLTLSYNDLPTLPIELMNLTGLVMFPSRGQSVCLSVADGGFATWLAGHDALWNDGCP